MKDNQILIYQNQEGNIKIDVRLEEETVWLTQEQMATLFWERQKHHYGAYSKRF